ncbi:MAG: nickel-dependent lactate racemase [Anaerolineae bacterium]|nr:nickel-dependent lactate racemase [Anaerolineae bacterium]MDW8102592.1 nickel-dependent lactate racemase [Anaerolineae bacterium]
MFKVPFGKGFLEFELPPGFEGYVVEPREAEPVPDLNWAVRTALAEPEDSPPLKEMARPGDKVCIVFTDATRASPDHVLVPALLRELKEAGVRDSDITLLCGVGMHRPSTYEEKVEKLTAEVVRRYRVIDHEAQNPKMLVDLGETETGIPLLVNRIACEADILIATGVVEPHQYAGYSGGRKTVAIGAGGEKTIQATHSPWILEHPGTRLGRIEGNPFHEAITEAARRAGLRFILNVINNDKGEVVAVKAGEPEAAFQELVTLARAIYEVPVPRQYDVVVAGVGYPKDVNLYQATRAASYIYFAPSPVVKPGGFIIVPAPCDEGPGQGVGEQRFFEVLKNAPDVQSILEEARKHGLKAGEQRAFIMAKVLEGCRVIIAGAKDQEMVRQAKMIPASDLKEAFSIASSELGGRGEVLIVPHALLTLPIVQEKSL